MPEDSSGRPRGLLSRMTPGWSPGVHGWRLPGGRQTPGKCSGCSPPSCHRGWERCAHMGHSETRGSCQVQLAGRLLLMGHTFLGRLDNPRNRGLSVLVHFGLLRNRARFAVCCLILPACLLEAGAAWRRERCRKKEMDSIVHSCSKPVKVKVAQSYLTL